jgi:autotransporter-associated beta strand protein
LAPATHTWTGAGPTHFNWSDPGNWSGGAPSSGESDIQLVFPAISSNPSPELNNDVPGLTVTSIQFTGPQYTLKGDHITLTGNTTISATAGVHFINFPIDQEAFFTVTTLFFNHVYDIEAGASLVVNGQVTGAPLANMLHKTGGGELLLNNQNNFGASVQIDQGKLVLENDSALGPQAISTTAVTVSAGATLDLDGTNPTFGSLSGAGTVTNSSASTSSLETGNDNTNTEFQGTISSSPGNIDLAKLGTGTFTLDGANTYSGLTDIAAGAVFLGSDQALPIGTDMEVDHGAIFDLGGHNANLSNLSGNGTVQSATTATLFLGLITDVTFDGVIAFNISLDISAKGSPKVTLNGVNTFTGSIAIHEGTLIQGVDFAIPPVAVQIDAGATLDLNGHQASLGSLSGDGTVIYDPLPMLVTLTTGLDNTSTEFDGVISGNINLVKTGTGTFTLGGVNTYAGSTTVQAGTLAQAVDNAAPPNPCIVAAGATFDLHSHHASLGSLSGAGTVSTPAKPIFSALTTGLDNTSTEFDGVISGSIDVAKSGTGTFTLGGASTYAGSTTVQAGTLTLGIDNAVPPNPCIIASGATLDVHFHNEMLGSLAGAGSVFLSDPTLTTGADNTSTTFSGVITGSGNLTKVGSGTFTLSGSNTYTGSTTVLSGVLDVTGSLPPNTVVTVAPGAMITGSAPVPTATINGTGGNDTFVINTTGVTLNGTPVVTNPYTTLTINALGGNVTFDVLGTNAGSTTILNAGTGADLFNIGSAASTITPIQGAVTINGPGGNDALAYNDQGAPGTGQVIYTITHNSLSRSGAATVTYAGIGSVNFQARNAASNGSSNGNFVGVDSTAAGTSYRVNAGTGYNQFIVKRLDNTLNGIQGALALHGSGAGNSNLAEFTDIDPAAHTYLLTAGSAPLSGMVQRFADQSMQVPDLAPFAYDGMNSGFVLDASGGPHTVNIQSESADLFSAILTGTGTTVTVGSQAPALGGTLAGIVGDLRIQSLLGQKPQVTLDDSGNTSTAARTISLGSDPTFGYLVNGLANSSQTRGRLGLQLDPSAPVSIRTGATSDTFHIRDFAGAPSLQINAGGGINTLDYSAYVGNVSVIMPLGMATGFSGISNIRNVTGGIGNDLLVGDANPNRLIGGTGRNILIGGAGADTLDASRSQGDNILIGGTTIYDGTANYLAALDAVFAEWTRTDLGFAARHGDLQNGENGTGATPLNTVNGQLILLNNQTVEADGAADTMIGSNQTDPTTQKRVHNWFFFDSTDAPLVNFDPASDHKTKVK